MTSVAGDLFPQGGGSGGGGAYPAGSGSEIQYRASGSALGAVTGSSVDGSGNVTLATVLVASDLRLGAAATLLKPWGQTSSFPAFARSGAVAEVKLADDSAYAAINALDLRLSAVTTLFKPWGSTSSFPALKRSGADLYVRLADDSTFGILGAAIVAAFTSGSANKVALRSEDGLALAQDMTIKWSNGTNESSGAKDIGLARAGAGILKVTDGGAGAGQLQLDGTTGAGTPSLGTNSPASTLAAPNTWLTVKKLDGTQLYVPAWA